MALAELAYVFRHALLRDAAYQLQLPGDRARLHALAFASLEEFFGGRPAERKPDEWGDVPYVLHATDPIAEELAQHAAIAGIPATEGASRGPASFYLRRAAEFAERQFAPDLAIELWRRHADMSEGLEKAGSLRRGGRLAANNGRMSLAESLLLRGLEES